MGSEGGWRLSSEGSRSHRNPLVLRQDEPSLAVGHLRTALSPSALVLGRINQSEAASRLARRRHSLAFGDRDLVAGSAAARPNLFVLPRPWRPLTGLDRFAHSCPLPESACSGNERSLAEVMPQVSTRNPWRMFHSKVRVCPE